MSTIRPILIGDLDKRVQLLRRAGGSDRRGGEEPGWYVLARRWANVVELSGQHEFLQQGERSRKVVRVIVRKSGRYDVTENDRVRYRGADLGIKNVRDLEEVGRFLELLCVETK